MCSQHYVNSSTLQLAAPSHARLFSSRSHVLACATLVWSVGKRFCALHTMCVDRRKHLSYLYERRRIRLVLISKQYSCMLLAAASISSHAIDIYFALVVIRMMYSCMHDSFPSHNSCTWAHNYNSNWVLGDVSKHRNPLTSSVLMSLQPSTVHMLLASSKRPHGREP